MKKYGRVVWINLKYITKCATQWTGSVFAILGFVGIFVSFDDLFNEQTSIYIKIGFSILIFVAVWLLMFIGDSIYIFCKKRFEILDAGNNHHVYVQYGNVFSPDEVIGDNKTRNVVISVNRCFDTIVDDDLISSNTLHGIALKELYKTNMYTKETLNQTIKDKLSQSKCDAEKLCRQNKRKGNLERYSPGTVVEVEAGPQLNYFFLGLTRFDKNLHANMSEEEYVLALARLLEFCNLRSQGYPVVMPLIGAGAANDTQKSERDILEFMIKFIKINRRLINCDIHIVVRDNGRDSIGIADIA